jgi:hypothetical protein
VWPDDPWLEAGQLGGAHRRCHLTIVGLVSKVDDGGNLAAIEGLADSIYLALVAAKLPTPTISGPDPYDAGGITYTAVRARLVLSIGP